MASNPDSPTRLSEILSQADPTTRRQFLGASTLGLVVGGATLTACQTEAPEGQPVAQSDSTRRAQALANPNSKLDTALHGQVSHGAQTSAVGVASSFRRFNPELPPLSSDRTVRINWRAMEVPVRITPDLTVAAWTFEGDIPGPIVHCRVGDTIEFTLTNEGAIPHSMDFHAAQIDPKVAFRSVLRGQTVNFTFKPKWAGAFMYHCGSAPVLMHIGAGMYGALIVSPTESMPAAKEFVLVQSEFYLGSAGPDGHRPFDYDKMMATTPDYMAFNGRPLQYVNEPIRVKVGDRVRFWVVNCGPTHSSHFHVVGEQFDTMYLGAPPLSPIRGVQTFDVPAGGGMVFELLCDVAGEFPFVNHGFGHAQKGAIGILLVE